MRACNSIPGMESVKQVICAVMVTSLLATRLNMVQGSWKTASRAATDRERFSCAYGSPLPIGRGSVTPDRTMALFRPGSNGIVQNRVPNGSYSLHLHATNFSALSSWLTRVNKNALRNTLRHTPRATNFAFDREHLKKTPVFCDLRREFVALSLCYLQPLLFEPCRDAA